MDFGSHNKGKKIVISGTYGTGKTTTTNMLSAMTGLPMAVARGMRDILPETFPGKKLEECTPNELVQLGLIRFAERKCLEGQLANGFISDGSAIHEWAYGHGRQLEGTNGHGSEIFGEGYDFAMSAFGEVVKRHSKGAYTHIVHLPVEFPLPQDGHRPVSEKFRSKADDIITSTWQNLGFDCHTVTGTLDERVSKIIQLLGLEVSPTLNGPVSRSNGKLWYARAEDALGNAADRFFSNGFRNLQHDIYDVEIDPLQGAINAKVDLSYTGAWSKQNGVVRTPHLSSVDSILITGQLAQMLMYAQDGLKRGDANNLWLRKLEIIPGRKPIEDVTGIPVRTQIINASRPRMGGKYWHAADIEAVIGQDGFKLNAEVAYELPQIATTFPSAAVPVLKAASG